ncbi:L,D-transpeptidase catalytic domain [Giesbergeria anulus]|uniref:L,D-transpeptidase catalytic domain n=2 Tax=Giesbergeria anulus TaxID=180197 RepID=A0A1H9KRH4_9BURK|nr:L,D-transpeptidase catalytic domain [Giesbergeria anulus]
MDMDVISRYFSRSGRAGPGAALAATLAALLVVHTPPATAQQPSKPTNKASKKAPPAALVDGQAESRLLEVYQSISQGQHRQALAGAEALVRDYPNFQLAQLVLGDLWAARARPAQPTGAVPGAHLPSNLASATDNKNLDVLREESRRRLQALHARPPANTIPAQFLTLSPRQRHAVAVDASRSRLYLFENTPDGLRLVADYYASVGKLGIDKYVEGDQRTPIGVYFITSRLDPSTLRDFYGAGALPLNYPNPLDQSRGKTGSGIWLHGTPPHQFARAPQATDGCVALANPDLERLLRTVERSTPVVIAPELRWVAPHSVDTARQQFDTVLQAWSDAKAQGDVQSLQRFYTADFKSASQQPRQQWLTKLASTSTQQSKEVELKDKSYLHWRDASETMVVTFGEVTKGERSGTTRRQYWKRQGDQWQIFYEGVIS